MNFRIDRWGCKKSLKEKCVEKTKSLMGRIVFRRKYTPTTGRPPSLLIRVASDIAGAIGAWVVGSNHSLNSESAHPIRCEASAQRTADTRKRKKSRNPNESCPAGTLVAQSGCEMDARQSVSGQLMKRFDGNRRTMEAFRKTIRLDKANCPSSATLL